MANLTRALVIEPTFAEAETLHDSLDGETSKLAQMMRRMLFTVLRDSGAEDAEAPAPISITVTLREAS